MTKLPTFIRRGAAAAAAVGLLAATAGSPAAALTVYTAVEAEDLKKYAARFNEDHPDIEIKWVRDSTGIVTAKLLAESAAQDENSQCQHDPNSCDIFRPIKTRDDTYPAPVLTEDDLKRHCAKWPDSCIRPWLPTRCIPGSPNWPRCAYERRHSLAEAMN